MVLRVRKLPARSRRPLPKKDGAHVPPNVSSQTRPDRGAAWYYPHRSRHARWSISVGWKYTTNAPAGRYSNRPACKLYTNTTDCRHHADAGGSSIRSAVYPGLLAHLDLTGMVVTGDAMQTQRPLSIQIVEAGGDYLWFVKENQPRVHPDIERLFTPLPSLPGTSEDPTDFTTAHQIEAAHGRLEERRITVSSWLQEYSDWPYLAQVFKLERTSWRSGKSIREVR